MAYPTQSKVAFISVFDKTGLEPLAQTLVNQYGYHLLATGGTYTFLKERNIPVQEASDITGFTELLGGRVKSLHPELFAAILSERNNPEHTVPFVIDTVIVNLYPFEQEQATEAAQKDPDHLVHFIDIGGSALIRAAAKNHRWVNVLCQSNQYDRFLQELKFGEGTTSLSFRKQLATEAFQRSVTYDTAILNYFSGNESPQATEKRLPQSLTYDLQKIQDLRYGENPHQQAALYGLETNTVDFELLHGKELSYNNILDMQAGWNIVTEFEEVHACAIIKHNNPCGVAISRKSLQEAYQTAFDADPLSAFGGVVAFNNPVDEVTALQLKEVFLEVIIAPGFESEAIELLTQKKNLRLVQRPLPVETGETAVEVRQVTQDLFLIQRNTPHGEETLAGKFQMPTHAKPTPEQLEDMVFAWNVVKHVKSNAIVIAKNGRTVGIGGGQTSRIGALENALKQACDDAKDAVVASDGFLPHEDNIYAAVQARVGAIIQPGGSIKDPDIIALANQYQLPLVLTGVREFKH